MTRRRILIGLVVAPLLLFGLVAGTLELVYKATDGLWEVVDGKCYRAAEMEPGELVEVCERLGIRAVVDLRSELDGLHDKPPGWSLRKIEAERQALAAAGIRHINVPARQVSDRSVVNRFVDALSQPGSRPVLIHCDHGIGRTGFFVAIYLIEFEGYTPAEARRRVARFYSLRPGGRRHFRADFNKGKHLMDYVPRSERQPGAAHDP